MKEERPSLRPEEPTKRSISFDPEVKKIPTEKSSSGDAELPLSAQQLTSKNNPALKSELVKELEGKIAAAKARAKNDQKNMRLAEIKGGEQPTRGKAKAKASKKKSKRESSSNSLDSEEPLSDEYDQDECDDEDDDEDLPKESKEKAAKPTTKTEAEKKTSKKTTKPETEEDPSKAKRPKKAAKIEQQKPTRQAFLKEAAKEFPNEPNTKKRKAKVQPTGNESAAESREKTSINCAAFKEQWCFEETNEY